MIALYHNDMSVCAQKVRMALAEKQLPWESHHLDLRAGDQQKPEYVKLNPNAVVPTLVHNSAVLIESTVICEYLDDAYPELAIRPKDPVARARMRLWTKQLDEGVHAATSTISNGIAFRHQKLVWGMEKLEEFHRNMPNAARREQSWENITKGVESRYFADAAKRFDKLLADMEAALALVDGSSAMSFHSPTSATRRTSPDWTTCSCSSYGTGDRVLPTGTSACANGAVMPLPSTAGPTSPTMHS
jgi:glutathione S-transferase